MKVKKNKEAILKYLDSEFEDTELSLVEQKQNEQVLHDIGFPKDSLIYALYKKYDIAGFNFEGDGEEDGFLFDSLALIDDLKDIGEFVHENWSIPKEYIPFSDGEIGYYTFYHSGNQKIFFCDVNLSEDIPKNSEKTWENFETFLLQYLGA